MHVMATRPFEQIPLERTPLFTILGCYLAPVLFYTLWGSGQLSAGWAVWSVGLVLTLFGTAALYTVVQSNLGSAPVVQTEKEVEAEQPEKVMSLSALPTEEYASLEAAYNEAQEHNHQLSDELKETLCRLREAEQEGREQQQHLQAAHTEAEKLRVNEEQYSKAHATENASLQEMVSQQQANLEAQEQYIAKLKKQNADLSYEVKTLLQLGEMEGSTDLQAFTEQNHEPLHPALDSLEPAQTVDVDTLYHTIPTSTQKQIGSGYDAAIQLQQCVELAEGIESAPHQTNGSRFSDLTNSNQALDLRRLADTFRTEISAPVLFINPADGMLLFASNQVQGLLGWMPEKLIKDFYTLLQDGLPDWQQSLQGVATQGETTVRLILRAKSGEDLMTYAHLGAVRTGVFMNYVVAVLYPPLRD
jgi:hypothetical protein